jgi:hypothetical protein
MVAGVFQFISDNLTAKFDVPSSADVSTVSLNFLIKWSLAAAQECFVLKGIAEKTIKDGMVAKLALATGHMYESAKEMAEGLGIGSIYGKVLGAFLLGKASYYKSLAQFKKSTEAFAANRYGEEISRLNEASQILNRTKEIKKLLDPETVNHIETLSGQITKNLERAIKDNSIIYHETIPTITGLPDIGQAVVARPIAVPDWSKDPSVPSRPILSRLVPETIRARSVEYYQKRNEMIEEIYSRLKGLKLNESEIMRECNLPSLLDVAQTNMGIPASILEKSQNVRSSGGAEALYSSLTTIESLKEDAKQLLRQVEELLSEENMNDLRMRQEFGDKWTRPESETLAKNLHQALESYKKSLILAGESDTKLQKEFDDAIAGITSLDSSQAELEESIRASTAQNSQRGDLATAAKLRQKLSKTANFEAERNLFTDRIQSYAANDQVEELFTSMGEEVLRDDTVAQKIISERLNSDEMVKFIEETDKIECEQQVELADLRTLAISFAASLTLSSALEERQNALQTLESAYVSYTNLTGHFQEALTFYSGLLDLLQKLRENTRDFTVSRGIELEEIKSSLQRAVATTNISANTSGYPSSNGSNEVFLQQQQQHQHQQQQQQPQVQYFQAQPIYATAAAPTMGSYMMPPLSSSSMTGSSYTIQQPIMSMHSMPVLSQQQWQPGMPVQYANTPVIVSSSSSSMPMPVHGHGHGQPFYTSAYQQQPSPIVQVQQYPGTTSSTNTSNNSKSNSTTDGQSSYFKNPYSQQ